MLFVKELKKGLFKRVKRALYLSWKSNFENHKNIDLFSD